MKLVRIILIPLAVLLLVSTGAAASDFNWTRNFNRQAKIDPVEFRNSFAERFNLEEMQVVALLNIFDTPADAYIMMRLGEIKGVLKKMSKEQGIDAVKKYRENKDKGWTTLAEIFGVEPESEEFCALKAGHDIPGIRSTLQVTEADREKSRRRAARLLTLVTLSKK